MSSTPFAKEPLYEIPLITPAPRSTSFVYLPTRLHNAYRRLLYVGKVTTATISQNVQETVVRNTSVGLASSTKRRALLPFAYSTVVVYSGVLDVGIVTGVVARAELRGH